MKQVGFIFLLFFLLQIVVHCLAEDARRFTMIFDPKALEISDVSGFNLSLLKNSLKQQCFALLLSKTTWDDFMIRRYRMEQLIAGNSPQDYVLGSYFKKRVMSAEILEELKKTAKDIDMHFSEIKNYMNDLYQQYLEEKINVPPVLNETMREYLSNVFVSYPILDNQEIRDIFKEDLLCYLIDFNKDDWIIKTYQDSVIILIPRSYLADCLQSVSAEYKVLAQEFIKTHNSNFSLRELILGIKIDHLPSYDLFDPKAMSYYFNQDGQLKLSGSVTLPNGLLQNIFVTRTDLGLIRVRTKSNDDKYEQLLHPWYIYLSGHGNTDEKFIKSMVTGLSIAEFKKILYFFNTQVLTRFLMYNTCFGGGLNLQKIFAQKESLTEKLIKSLSEEFNYTIVSGATLDTLVFGPLVKTGFFDVLSTQKISIVPIEIKPDICGFFKRLSVYFGDSNSEKKEASFAEIINLIQLFKVKHLEVEYSNPFVPMIKFAHSPWFFIEDIDKKIVRITDMTLKRAVANQQPIIIKNKDFVFFDTPYIPIPIIFEENPKMFLISIPGNINVHIEYMELPKLDSNDFPQLFQIAYGPYQKTFTIKTLILNDTTFSQVAFVPPSLYGERNLFYQKHAVPPTISPTIEQGIERRSLAEYSPRPIVQLLQKRQKLANSNTLPDPAAKNAIQKTIEKKSHQDVGDSLD